MNDLQFSLFGALEFHDDGAIDLRGYQVECIEQIEAAFARGSRSPLLTLPTGSGKTVVAAEIIRRELLEGGSALFLAPRRELIHQASRKLAAARVAHGVLLAGAEHLRSLYARAQVASIDTLASRLKRNRVVLPEFSLVIVDEAHLSVTARQQALLDRWPNARRIGLTATPTRKDGRALGVLYDRLVEPVTTAALTTAGYLAPARFFSIAEPDLKRVRITAGDYNAQDLAAVVNRPELVGDVVRTWLQRAPGRRTVCFAVNVAHSVALCDAFLRAGVAAEHVDAETPQGDRDATFARFASGETQVLTNCMLASYGFDLPELSCVVLAKPTRSLMLYLQMVGRGLRTAPGKVDCLVLDHSGCVHRHGFAADERKWTLEGRSALANAAALARDHETREAKEIDCPECRAVFRGRRDCPECGFYLAPKGKEVRTLDGELVEIGTHLEIREQERMAFYVELRGYAQERGYKPAWAAHSFREKFGHAPPTQWNAQPAALPSLTTRRWIKSRLIRWSKGRKRGAMQAVAADVGR